jgi:hypothetical protein
MAESIFSPKDLVEKMAIHLMKELCPEIPLKTMLEVGMEAAKEAATKVPEDKIGYKENMQITIKKALIEKIESFQRQNEEIFREKPTPITPTPTEPKKHTGGRVKGKKYPRKPKIPTIEQEKTPIFEEKEPSKEEKAPSPTLKRRIGLNGEFILNEKTFKYSILVEEA